MANLLNLFSSLLQNYSSKNFNTDVHNFNNYSQNFNQSDIHNFQNGTNNFQSIEKQNNPISPPSDYPEVFFTSNKINSHNTDSMAYQNFNQQNINSQNSNNQAMLNPSMINLLKNFLPIFSGKNSKQDFSSVLKNINPNFSNIFSIFSVKKNDDKKDNEGEQTPNLLDLSDLTKIK